MQLVAKGHAKRKTDGEKYPGLEQLNHLFNNHGDVGSYIQVSMAETADHDMANDMISLIDLLIASKSSFPYVSIHGGLCFRLGRVLLCMFQLFNPYFRSRCR